jgi:hypothetical protein
VVVVVTADLYSQLKLKSGSPVAEFPLGSTFFNLMSPFVVVVITDLYSQLQLRSNSSVAESPLASTFFKLTISIYSRQNKSRFLSSSSQLTHLYPSFCPEALFQALGASKEGSLNILKAT